MAAKALIIGTAIFLAICACLSFIGWLMMGSLGNTVLHEIEGVLLLACFGIFVIGALLCAVLLQGRG